MLIIPAIDLRNGQCVRLAQGRKDATKVYNADPVEVALSFEDDGAEMLHVVDLDGAFSEPNSRNRRALRKILDTVGIPVQFGGGLRTTEDIFDAIDIGLNRVVIGTVAAESPETFAEMLAKFGSGIIVAGIDANLGQAVTRGWETEAEIDALTLARRVAAIGVERIVYTDIQRDGMLTGPNVEQTSLIARETGLKVTASGGVSSIDDLLKLKAAVESGVDSVIVGKALYERRFTLRAALEVLE
ncbi:MAG: 1-(5-phosphoribosyl)-5-[(5-phosphoribosylamino)methylideneamino]imidazole-4-carboxamide isomerase [Acidobacteria bacterium]|nr:MAG: 1-(5-phosphoribosyl)-5-[(5-phosphoribosylamino)methylideneamino]imidazole-4-carboxamide isomerase [Acidobacteriota bacterium]